MTLLELCYSHFLIKHFLPYPYQSQWSNTNLFYFNNTQELFHIFTFRYAWTAYLPIILIVANIEWFKSSTTVFYIKKSKKKYILKSLESRNIVSKYENFELDKNVFIYTNVVWYMFLLITLFIHKTTHFRIILVQLFKLKVQLKWTFVN